MGWQTGRLALSGLLAFGLAIVLVPIVLAWARRAGAGQHVRDDGPQSHLSKEGTPTLGGAALVPAVLVACMAVGWRHQTVFLLCALTLLFALWGMLDDYAKIFFGRALGIKARHKLAAQFVFSLLFIFGAARGGGLPQVQFGTQASWEPAFWLYCLLGVLYITAYSNAVNLTDGLDGLAGGVVAIAAAGLGAVCVAQGKEPIAYFCFSLTGGTLGFLVFNVHPARIFMGDTGALALGAGLAGAAVLAGLPLYLLVAALVPVIEAGSVAAQVISFQTTGKRILRMSPLHHHFELGGVKERTVVRGFWLTTLVTVTVAGVIW